MLFFFHLFAGIVFGLLLGDLLHDRRWILPCIIGSVLPDLIDKSLGYLIFSDIFGSGRIFFHSIVIVSVLLLFGYLVWRYWGHPEVLAAAFGILFHQVLDMMWEVPEDWYFPLFGISASDRGADYALTLLFRDFTSGSEWIFAIIIFLAIIVYLVCRYYSSVILQYRNLLAWFAVAGSLFFMVLAGVTLGMGINIMGYSMYRIYRFIRWDEPAEFILGGIVFLMAALLLWRIRLQLVDERKMIEPI